MEYELDGRTYFTETKLITRTTLYETRDNGQIMTCVFSSLPYNATEKQIYEYMLEHGAKVISDDNEPS